MGQISHYQLLDRIGRDGPTEIYRARDRRLDRDVAIRILRGEARARPGALERFRREARIASLVTHPHVCAVHDSGDEDGQAFLVCELLEGQALDELAGGAPLRPDRALEFGIQVADALAAAHRRGVVHGGIKPSNVFITTDGHVKLLELGAVAAGLPDRPTSTTPAPATRNALTLDPADLSETVHPYLSPEQARGAAPDERSDIFAAGALLYTMVTGRPPFAGASPGALLAEIAEGAPPRLRAGDVGVFDALVPIVHKAMSREPADRYASAAELLEDLRRARRAADLSSGVNRSLGATRRGRRRHAAGVAAGVVLLALAAGWGLRRAEWGPPAGPRSTVLVGHLANGTADPDFDGTLREAVAVYLGQSPYLDVVSEDRVRSALRMMGREGEDRMPHDVAVEVCRRLGLQATIEGSVTSVGRSTVLALVATDCATGDTVAREQAEVERKEEVLGALGQITASVRTALGESGASLATHNVPIEDATTPSFEALKAYTDAAAKRAAGRELDAIPLLERAIAIDSQFALAYTMLSTLYGGIGESGKSEDLARRAYDLRDRVSERERLFITYQYHDRVTGDHLRTRETLEVWRRTYPRDYRPANAMAVLLNRLGQYEAAAAEAEEARRRNPEHPFPYSNLAYAHRGAGRYAQARAVAQEALARNLETLPMRRLLYQIAEIEEDPALARAQLDWAASRRRLFDFTGARAQIAAFHGHLAEARALYRETLKGAREQGFDQVADGYGAQAALMEALYGFRQEALAWGRPIARGSTAIEARLRAAAALALSGAPAEAEPLVRRLRALRPDDTLLQAAYVVPAEAALELAAGRNEAAVGRLRPAAPYEFGIVAALIPAYLRGEAYLRAEDFAAAIREFTAVLEHRGADPFSPVVAMSQLRLAQAFARSGQSARASEALAVLRAEWKDADPEIRRLLDGL